MTLTTSVQDAVVRLGQDLAQRGWDLGCGVWAIHPHEDDSVTLEKRGGEEFLDGVPVYHLIEQITPPIPEHCGVVVSFDVWISDSGQAAETASDRVDARIILAALTSGTVLIYEYRADRIRARLTFDDGRSPPTPGLQQVAAHLRSKVCAVRPVSGSLPEVLQQLLQASDATAIIVIDTSKPDG